MVIQILISESLVVASLTMAWPNTCVCVTFAVSTEMIGVDMVVWGVSHTHLPPHTMSISHPLYTSILKHYNTHVRSYIEARNASGAIRIISSIPKPDKHTITKLIDDVQQTIGIHRSRLDALVSLYKQTDGLITTIGYIETTGKHIKALMDEEQRASEALGRDLVILKLYIQPSTDAIASYISSNLITPQRTRPISINTTRPPNMVRPTPTDDGYTRLSPRNGYTRLGQLVTGTPPRKPRDGNDPGLSIINGTPAARRTTLGDLLANTPSIAAQTSNNRDIPRILNPPIRGYASFVASLRTHGDFPPSPTLREVEQHPEYGLRALADCLTTMVESDMRWPSDYYYPIENPWTLCLVLLSTWPIFYDVPTPDDPTTRAWESFTQAVPSFERGLYQYIKEAMPSKSRLVHDLYTLTIIPPGGDMFSPDGELATRLLSSAQACFDKPSNVEPSDYVVHVKHTQSSSSPVGSLAVVGRNRLCIYQSKAVADETFVWRRRLFIN